jgi:PAS domain S-box-containing protein
VELGDATRQRLGIGILFDTIRDVVVAASARSETIVLWNETAALTFGYSSQEAIGMPLENLVPLALRERHRAGIKRFSETGEGPLIDSHQVLDLPALHKDGTEFDIELTLTPIEGGPGEERHVLAIIRDVTDRKRIESELRASHEQLQEAYATEQQAAAQLRELDELKSDFVAMVAHDLRSPMSVIAGFAGMLDSGWDRFGEEQKREMLQVILRNIEAQSMLVEDVLQASRLESGQFTYDMGPFDLYGLAERTIADLSSNEEDEERHRLVDPGEVPPAWGDEQRHGQVLRNLLSNATKFSDPGEPVDIEITTHEDKLQVSVRDRGIGIKTEDIPKLFGRFSRVDQSGDRKVTGTGLGLYICKRMIEDQGGTIRVDSQVGVGSTFSYTVPVADGSLL